MLRDWNFFTFSPLAPLLLPAVLAAGEEDEDAAVAAKVTDMIHPSDREVSGTSRKAGENNWLERRKWRHRSDGAEERSLFRGQGTVGEPEKPREEKTDEETSLEIAQFTVIRSLHF